MELEVLNAHYQLAISYEAEGNNEKAEKEYDFLIVHATDHPEILYKAYKGKLFLNTEKSRVRSELTAKMIEIFGDNQNLAERLFFDLSQFHKVTGDAERAIDALEQLIEYFPKSKYHTDSLLELGLLYQYHRKNVGLAIKSYVEFLNRAGKKHNGVRVAAVNLAECYNNNKQPEKAKAILKKHLKIE